MATQVQDANLIVTSFEVDGFGRVTREMRPDGDAFRRGHYFNFDI
ncbi:MAG TPA: hypothetical protein VGA56_10940 [Opitutaceae bacterium]